MIVNVRNDRGDRKIIKFMLRARVKSTMWLHLINSNKSIKSVEYKFSYSHLDFISTTYWFYIPQCGTYVHHCGMYVHHCGIYIPHCGI